MRRISIESVKDGDILAKDLFSSSGVVLMSEGTKLKKDYVPRLLELGVGQIFIADKEAEDNKFGTVIEEEVTAQFGDMVRTTIEKYTYTSTDELKEIVKVADEIISDILNEPETEVESNGESQRFVLIQR